MDTSYSCEDVCEAPAKPIGENGGDFEAVLVDGCLGFGVGVGNAALILVAALCASPGLVHGSVVAVSMALVAAVALRAGQLACDALQSGAGRRATLAVQTIASLAAMGALGFGLPLAAASLAGVGVVATAFLYGRFLERLARRALMLVFDLAFMYVGVMLLVLSQMGFWYAYAMLFVAVAAIADPVREDVPAAVARCMKAGIDIKIVTGDTPATAREIARRIGLWHDETDSSRNEMTGVEFAAMSDEELLERVQALKIMSRARPLDKQRLVRLLQRKGEIVAVTGDGTNDAPALNFANVGLSMGSGTSVAKDASDITLLDDSFASIAAAVMWGRSLYRNIQRFVLFQLTINFAAIIVVFVGSIFGTEMPLTVVQILWVNIIMDTFAALAMASLPPNPAVMNEPPRPKDEFIITPAMARTIFTCGTIFVGVLLGMLFYWRATTGELSLEQLTVFFSVFVFLQFWNMFNAKGFEACHSVLHDLRGSRTFFLVLLLIAVGQVLIVEFGGPVFRTTPLTWVQWLEVIGYTSLIAILGDVVRSIRRRIRPRPGCR